jgi:hypothetical protein
MNIKKVRDLTLVSIDNEKTMVISCDSCGGIGLKSGDSLKYPPFHVGKYTAKVALLEVLCSGADIVCITNAVCNEMNHTGEEIIKGIKEELKVLNIDNVTLTGSTEENINTNSTAVGVTVIGIVENNKLKVNNVNCNCTLISVGIPKVGNEINLDNDKEIASYEDLNILLNIEGILEIVPVGSKGIRYECEQLAISNNLNLEINKDTTVDLYKTAGPGTVLIAAIKNNYLEEIKKMKNLNFIGKLIKK